MTLILFSLVAGWCQQRADAVYVNMNIAVTVPILRRLYQGWLSITGEWWRIKSLGTFQTMTPSLTSSRSHQADVNHPHENFSEVRSTNFCFLKIVLLQSPPPTTKDVQSFIFMNLRVLSTTIFHFDPLYFYLIHPLILKISVSGGNLAEICIKHTTYWIFFANNIHIREP